MKKEDFYVFSNGTLYRKARNLVFQNEETLYEWPIHKIHSIRIYGNVTITTKLIKYLMNLGIDIYFYTSNGIYLGHITSLHNKGNAQYLIAQMEAYINNREHIAKQIVIGSIAMMLYTMKSIKYEEKTYKSLSSLLAVVKEDSNTKIVSLREKEARAWLCAVRLVQRLAKPEIPHGRNPHGKSTRLLESVGSAREKRWQTAPPPRWSGRRVPPPSRPPGVRRRARPRSPSRRRFGA